MSREAVLARIRAMLPRHDSSETAAPAAYRRMGTLSTDERLNMLEERLREYDARVFDSPEQALSRKIREILSSGGKSRMLHPEGVPSTWREPGIEWTADSGELSFAEIESFDGVLTGATAAVAESGSIVLQHGPGEGRRALTLLPDYHLCVIFKDQVVETLPECFYRLRKSADRPTTFISGPSATADIEMTRIKGVHGPRFLEVVLVT